MSLIICPECSHRISEWALRCPSCGLPREYFVPNVVMADPVDESSYNNEQCIARGYRINTQKHIRRQVILFTPSGERIEAYYYNKDLMIINREKVLGNIIGQVLTERDPTIVTHEFVGIEILSRKLPEHGKGHVVRLHLRDNTIIVTVCFPESKILAADKTNTTWEIESFNSENLYSPQLESDELKRLLRVNARRLSLNFDLNEYIENQRKKRIQILSERLGRKVYEGQCRSCGGKITSVDNQLCPYCGMTYVCHQCGYCPTCHKDPKDDPFFREMELRIRLKEFEYKTQIEEWEESDQDFDEDRREWVSEIDYVDGGVEEESYQYYYGDDEI